MTATTALDIDRESWVGHRWRQHCLGQDHDKERLDDPLMLGMQGSRQSGGEHPLSQRTSRIGHTPITHAIGPEGPLVTMWSVRGAPHAHRATRIDTIRDALAPLRSDDGGQEFVDAVTEVADALQHVVQGPTPKGEASAGMIGRVSRSLVRECATCGSPHVPDGIFRAAGRQAGLVLGPSERGATMLHPCPPVAQDKHRTPRQALLRSYFRVNGPTTRTLFRDWMAGGTDGVNALWEDFDDEILPVRVGTKRYDLPQSLAGAVREAPRARGVALVPANDPYLRQVDRTQLVPDPVRRRAVYRALSGPGALLVDGQVLGTWRYRQAKRDVSIEPFESLTGGQRAAAGRCAEALAASTGADSPTITWL